MKTCEWLCGISRILTHILFLHIPVRKTSSNGIDSDRRDRDKAADLMIVNFLNLFKFFPICSSPYSFFTDTYQFFLDLDFLPLLWRAFAISTSYFRSVSFEGIDRSIVLRVDRIFLFSLGHPRSRGDETLADSSCTNAAVRPEWICTCFFYW
jgi:hypothetical protein